MVPWLPPLATLLLIANLYVQDTGVATVFFFLFFVAITYYSDALNSWVVADLSKVIHSLLIVLAIPYLFLKILPKVFSLVWYSLQ